ncbi:MAG TPA: hypothetical protein VGI16_10120 [Candidatus Acidoferrum sp.]
MKIAVTWCVLACAASGAFAQSEPGQLEDQVTATKRVFAGIGPGLRAVKLGVDGRTYVLTGTGVLIFDKQDKQAMVIGASVTASATGKDARSAITYGQDCDVDAQGRVYVADYGANAVEVFSAEGTLLRSIAVKAPVSVAALTDGEVAVTTLREPRLVTIFDKNGRDVREFGDPEQFSDRADLNRFLSIGSLAADAKDHLYYAFLYVPEPMVRQFDRNGYSQLDIEYTALDAYPEAQAVRREIKVQEKRGSTPMFKKVMTAATVEHANGEVWMALGNTLLHFDSEGTRMGTYQIYTPDGVRLEANTILVEPERLLIGSDPLGIFAFDRPDKKNQP